MSDSSDIGFIIVAFILSMFGSFIVLIGFLGIQPTREDNRVCTNVLVDNIVSEICFKSDFSFLRLDDE